MTPEQAGPPHRLAGQRLDARVDDARRAPERPLHRPGVAVPVDRPRVGGPEGRADLGDPLRRPPRHGRPARQRGAVVGARRVPRLDHGVGDDRRRRRHGRRAAPRPVRDAAVLRLQHGRLLRALARDRRATPTPTSCPSSSWSTGSARTPTAVPVARLRREQPGAEVGRSSGSPATAEAVDDADRLAARRRRHRHRRARRRPRPTMDAAAVGRRRGLARRRSRTSRSTTPHSATACPTSCATSSRAREALGRLIRPDRRGGRL